MAKVKIYLERCGTVLESMYTLLGINGILRINGHPVESLEFVESHRIKYNHCNQVGWWNLVESIQSNRNLESFGIHGVKWNNWIQVELLNSSEIFRITEIFEIFGFENVNWLPYNSWKILNQVYKILGDSHLSLYL